MIVSARIFLILLVPLLTHGAPTPPPGDNNPHGGSQSRSPPGPQLPSLREILPQLLSPHNHGLGQPTNPNWPIHWQPLPEHTPSALSFHTNPKDKCWLQEGTMYRTSGTAIRQIQRNFQTRAAGVAITLRGDIIDLPHGISVVLSDHISLPADSPETRIRLVSDTEPEAQTLIVVPHNTQYRVRSDPLRDAELVGVLPAADRIFFTQGCVIFVPRDTTVIKSNIIRLPRGDTRIRSLRKEDLDKILDWCWVTRPAPGMPMDQLERYMKHCYYVNLWNINWWNIDEPSRFVQVK